MTHFSNLGIDSTLLLTLYPPPLLVPPRPLLPVLFFFSFFGQVSGMAKQFVVPGWRVGWLLVHDPAKHCAELRGGILNLSQLILGCATLIQVRCGFGCAPLYYYIPGVLLKSCACH